MSVTIKFLGAAGTVTGSKYLIESSKNKILVDAGMFQGSREWREKNWDSPDVDLKEIDVACLTHAHIDHTGILPRFFALGLKAPVFCTPSTLALTKLLLEDSAKLQEQEAEYRSTRGKSRHNPPLPLYNSAEAKHALGFLRSVNFEKRTEICPNVYATWNRMGHILGAASITLEIEGKVINFSGDIGRYDVPILVDPHPIQFGDLLLIESTYGDRLHPSSSPKEILKDVINRTVKRKGVLVIPSFAVGRAQLLLYYLRELKEDKSIPDIPVIIDSPMATDATKIYKEHPNDYDEEVLHLLSRNTQPFHVPKMGFVRETKDSIKLNSIKESMIIISASGMLSGGRILHHLKQRISDERNTILFVGYQPPGGRGDWIKSGAPDLRLFGETVPIKAEIAEISGLSAHADKNELLRWCSESAGEPSKVAIVHGEPDSALAFKESLISKFKWNCLVAKYLECLSI